MTIPRMRTLWLAAAILTAAPAPGVEKLDDWLKKLQDSSASTRREAWQRSEHQGAPAILPLVKLASGDDSDVRLAALRSLERIAHAAAAPNSDRREAVAAELAKGLSEKAPPAVRSLLLDLLGSVGSGEQVAAIAPILLDSQLRDAARRALGRIPGTRATKALLKVAESQIGEALEALVWTLAERRDPEAVPLLADLSRRGARSTRVAAARALIRIGDEAAREAVVAVMPQATPRERAAISADLIDYAHRLRAEGKTAMADGLFGVILANAAEPQHRSAALLGLCADDPAAYLDLLVSVLDSSREDSLWRLALSMLTRAQGEGIDRSLLIDYAVSEGGRKASLLSVLARRKVEGVERLVEAAVTEDDLNVRVTALSLSGRLGSVELEPLIFQALREGTPEVRAVAFQSYLELAEEVTKTSAAAAASMYTNILDHTDDGGVRARALLGLGATGTELAADRILFAREIPQLARDAERAQLRYAIAIGKRGEKKEAIELLTASVGSGQLPRGEVREAIDALKSLGADPTVLQKRRGLLTDWWYLGPFPNEAGKGFSTAYSPERGVDLISQKDHRGRDRKWGEHKTNHLDGIVDFERLFRRTQNVLAYVYTEIEMPEARQLTFKIGSDDGYVCWLNGERIHGNDVTRGLTPDQDTFKATFEKGKNKILLKVTQGGGPWAFVLRLMDGEGKPIDLNRLK